MSLTSVAAPVWNEIAKTQTLRTEWARKAFAMDGMEMAELEDKEFSTLKAKVGHDVAMAFQDVMPLLTENVAISKYTQERPQMKQALPEIVSISEAIALASMDRPLNPMQQASLRNLLKAEYR